jgi:hypothetical protein
MSSETASFVYPQVYRIAGRWRVFLFLAALLMIAPGIACTVGAGIATADTRAPYREPTMIGLGLLLGRLGLV